MSEPDAHRTPRVEQALPAPDAAAPAAGVPTPARAAAGDEPAPATATIAAAPARASAAERIRSALPLQQLGVIVVGMSLTVWWPAFTLGAWGEVFFDDLLKIWAAATAAFLLAMLLPGVRRRLGWISYTLLLPSLWLVLNFIVPPDGQTLAVEIVLLFGVLVVIVGVPFMFWALAKVIWPEIGDTIPGRGKLLVGLTVLVVAAASFFLGANQSHFLTCEDFTISGNSEPPGCVHATPLP